MTTEFVRVDNGKETDWIDPVIDFRETDDGYWIDNGFAEYWLAKGPGISYLIRQRSGIEP